MFLDEDITGTVVNYFCAYDSKYMEDSITFALNKAKLKPGALYILQQIVSTT